MAKNLLHQPSNHSPIPPVLFDQDLLQHIEDTRLHWVSRDGHPTKLAWNELTGEEKTSLRRADERALFVTLFNPGGAA